MFKSMAYVDVKSNKKNPFCSLEFENYSKLNT